VVHGASVFMGGFFNLRGRISRGLNLVL